MLNGFEILFIESMVNDEDNFLAIPQNDEERKLKKELEQKIKFNSEYSKYAQEYRQRKKDSQYP